MTLREKYEKHYGIVLDDMEIHHIIPRHAGGTDDIENLIALRKDDHALAHLKRYEETGDFRDLCAYHMIGYNFSEAHFVSSSNGGKLGGRKVYEQRAGIFRSEEERKIWASMGGKVGGKVQAEQGLGFHKYKTDPELHKSWSSKGGKTSGQFQNKEFQSEMGKRGGVKNKGFIWLNDGKKTIKYTMKQQKTKSIDDFILENPQYRLGRLRHTNTKCPHCGKEGAPGAMALHHFDKCKEKK